ncbi:MAG: hypothetical protein CL840_00595 [Crocinitomicaceae bacterium]|nr:hypothetical protein [Crocinitomicaceae bacterium]
MTINTVYMVAIVLLIVALAIIRATQSYMKASKVSADFETMLNDIDTLLSIEELHCRNNSEQTGVSMKNKMRKYVLTERQQALSGKFTRSSIAKMREAEKARKAKFLDPIAKINLMKLLKLVQ